MQNCIQNNNALRSNPPNVMNVIEAATYIGISPRKLRDLIANREIRQVRIGTRCLLRLVDIDKYLESKLEVA